MKKQTVIKGFIHNLTTVLNRFSDQQIKKSIGDSVNNNRTVSVNQLVRFLSSSNSPRYRSLARRLSAVHGATMSEITFLRFSRTDAHSVTELLEVLQEAAHSGLITTTTQEVAQVIKSA